MMFLETQFRTCETIVDTMRRSNIFPETHMIRTSRSKQFDKTHKSCKQCISLALGRLERHNFRKVLEGRWKMMH